MSWLSLVSLVNWLTSMVRIKHILMQNSKFCGFLVQNRKFCGFYKHIMAWIYVYSSALCACVLSCIYICIWLILSTPARAEKLILKVFLHGFFSLSLSYLLVMTYNSHLVYGQHGLNFFQLILNAIWSWDLLSFFFLSACSSSRVEKKSSPYSIFFIDLKFYSHCIFFSLSAQ